MRPRDSIKNLRDYESFLRSRGFSRNEARILASAYKRLPQHSPAGCESKGTPQPLE